MLLEELKALKEGTLIVISDHYEIRVIFHKENVGHNGYYYFGSAMYPPSWIRIANSDEFNQNIERYKKAYEIAKKQTGER